MLRLDQKLRTVGKIPQPSFSLFEGRFGWGWLVGWFFVFGVFFFLHCGICVLLAYAVSGVSSVSILSGHPTYVLLPWYQVGQNLAKTFPQLVFVPVASYGA